MHCVQDAEIGPVVFEICQWTDGKLHPLYTPKEAKYSRIMQCFIAQHPILFRLHLMNQTIIEMGGMILKSLYGAKALELFHMQYQQYSIPAAK